MSSQYNLAKGPVDPQVFNMISVYDGHKSGVGRVVVDTTWHHWYGMNIDGIESAGGANWDKIGRYFLNIAKYLAPENVFKQRCWYDIIDVQFRYSFDEEQLHLGVGKNLFEVGRVFEEALKLRWGQCGVLTFIFANICELRPHLCEVLERVTLPPFAPDKSGFPPGPDPVCLTCPPFEAISAAFFGRMIKGTEAIRNKLYSAFYEGKPARGSISVEEIQKLAQAGAVEALKEVEELVMKDLNRSLDMWSLFRNR